MDPFIGHLIRAGGGCFGGYLHIGWCLLFVCALALPLLWRALTTDAADVPEHHRPHFQGVPRKSLSLAALQYGGGNECMREAWRSGVCSKLTMLLSVTDSSEV